MRPSIDVDVAIAGGSLAGCAAAHRLAREGLRVAVVEKSPDPLAYKRLCGHYIQAGALPEIRRLGLAAPIERVGGVRNAVDVHTPLGWIRRPRGHAAHGYSLRRLKLDPLVRRLATETPGVTYLGGHVVDELRADGLGARDRDGRRRRIRARLVVGADGRRSSVARLAGVPAASSRNDRFCYFAYYADLEEPGRVWRGARDVVLAVPNDDGLTVVAACPHRDGLTAFAADPAAGIERMARALPDGPSLERAHRVSKVLGYRDHANVWRSPAPGGHLALIGDAALSLDPVPAIGCGWALQSAAWLADAVVPALRGESDLDAALAAYAREHERQLGGHRRLIAEGSLAGPPSETLALLLRAASRDEDAARLFFALSTRSAPVQDLLTPAALERLRSVAG